MSQTAPSTDDKTTYADRILFEKSAKDCCEIVRYRLSEAKIVNEQFQNLFNEIAHLKKSYANQLRKLIAENENLRQNIANQLLSKQVVSQEELASLREFNSLGTDVPQIYTDIIESLKNDLQNNVNLTKTLQNEVIPAISNFNENDTQWNETKRLHAKVSKSVGSSSNNLSWESTGPLLFQMFETTDYERLQFLKSILLEFGLLSRTNSDQKLEKDLTVLKSIENLNSNNEIKRFANEVVKYQFHFAGPRNHEQQQQQQQQPATNNANGKNEKTLRHTSSTTVLKHDLMTDIFTGSKNKHSENNTSSKKTGSKLKSKFGSVFGRKKKDENKQKNVGAGNKNSNFSTNNKTASSSRASLASAARANFVETSAHSVSSTPSSARTPDPHANNYSQWKARNPSVSNNQVRSSRASTFVSTADTTNQNVFSRGEPHTVATQTSESSEDIYAPSSVKQPVQNIPAMQPQQQYSTQQQYPQPQQQYSTQQQYPQQQQQHYQQQQQYQQYQPQPPVQEAAHEEGHTSNASGLAPIQESGLTASREISSPQYSHVETHHQPPAPPPSRKQFGGNGNEPRVQSQIFQNLNVSPIDRHQSILLPNMTGELMTTLDPQATGHTSMDATPGFNHATQVDGKDGVVGGLKGSVAEVINCSYVSGNLDKLDVIGEVALNYETLGTQNIPLEISLKMESENFKPEKLICNKAFMEKIETLSESSEQSNGHREVYRINPTFIASKTLGAIKYNITSADHYVPPVSMLPVWKFEDHQASMVLTIKPNKVPLTLENLSVFVAVEDCETSTALSKPQGSFNKEKNRIAWRFNKEPIVFNDLAKDELKLVARFMTNKMGKESRCNIRFNVSNYSEKVFQFHYKQSTDSDPFGNMSDVWEPLDTVNTLVTGQYVGRA